MAQIKELFLAVNMQVSDLREKIAEKPEKSVENPTVKEFVPMVPRLGKGRKLEEPLPKPNQGGEGVWA